MLCWGQIVRWVWEGGRGRDRLRDWGGVQVNGSNMVIMLVRLRCVDVWGVNCDSVEGDESNWFGRDRDMAMDLRGEICLAKCEGTV